MGRRACFPGGFVVAYEGDFPVVATCHPPCAALETIHRVSRGLFQNPPAGRRLVHYFRNTGAGNIRAGAWTGARHDDHEEDLSPVGRSHRSCCGGEGDSSPAEVDEMIAGLIELEGDRSSVLVKFPDMWVIGTK